MSISKWGLGLTPIYPLLLTLPLFPLPRKGKILGMAGSVLIERELDIALALNYTFKDLHKTFVPPAQWTSPLNNISRLFLRDWGSNRMLCILIIVAWYEQLNSARSSFSVCDKIELGSNWNHQLYMGEMILSVRVWMGSHQHVYSDRRSHETIPG